METQSIKRQVARLFNAIKTADTPVVPAGWYTIKQLSCEMHKSISATQRIMQNGIRIGKCEKRVFTAKSGKVIRPIVHYRVK